MFLLDTDIIIYSLKGFSSVLEKMRAHTKDPQHISVITYGELVYGAEKSAKRLSNLAKVRALAEIFPIINATPAVMTCYGQLNALLKKKGTTVDSMDLIIAATAITGGYTLVTNNTKHFKKIPGLHITNWHSEN